MTADAVDVGCQEIPLCLPPSCARVAFRCVAGTARNLGERLRCAEGKEAKRAINPASRDSRTCYVVHRYCYFTDL